MDESDLVTRVQYVVTGTLAAVAAFKAWRLIQARAVKAHLQARANRKRAERDSFRRACLTDPATPGYLPNDAHDLTAFIPADPNQDHAGMIDHPVTDLTAEELTTAIRSGEFTCQRATEALGLRAALAGEALQSNAEEMFDKANAAARKVDQSLQQTKDLPPLLGVAISVKDSVHVKGYDSTCGAACRTYRPAEYDAVIVEMLRDAGAIPMVRGNVPQQLMMPMTSNAIWGTAVNPWDFGRTPGGSSGGEGVLVAVGAVPIAIGTDIGGSIRIPASNNGVFGFKPTPQRMSMHGMPACRPGNSAGQEAIRPTAGPLARCVADLTTVMRVLWKPEGNKMFAADPYCTPLPFDEVTYNDKRSLRIGYFVHDGWMHSAPSYARAVDTAVEELTAKGHTMVPFTVPEPLEFPPLMYGLLSADGGMHGYVQGLEGEDLHSDYSKIYFLSQIPAFLRPVVSWILRRKGDDRLALVTDATDAKSTREFWEYMKRLQAYKKRFVAEMEKSGLDALINPSGSLPALPHESTKEMTPSFSPSFLYNVLHFPAGIVPLTTVRPGEEVYEAPTQDKLTAQATEALRGAGGMPIGVQVATLPYRDELCLRVMADLESACETDLMRPSTRKINGETSTDEFFAEQARKFA
mmetsp:Transcript_30064/g.78892  ORF Transcript_30064/g.78892 Transcript_30064/m.78892 type:complete len:636 (+) Transcript_30064:121-2028(+)